MSPRDLFRHIKRTAYRHSPARRARAAEQLLEVGQDLLRRQRPLCRLHLHNLATASALATDHLVFGYALERVARKLEPRLIGHDPSRPTLCMVCIGRAYAETVAPGTQTKIDYCQRHGYNLAIVETVPYRFDRHAAWLRIPLLFRLMQTGCRDLFYLDADSIITNPDIRLEDFFARLEASRRHLMIAEDVYSLNTGAFFIRNTWQSLTLLDLIYESGPGSDRGAWEQQVLIDLVEENPAVKALLSIETETRRFNSMPFDRLSPTLPSDRTPYAWQPGDFLCHFAGTRSRSELDRMMRKFQGSSKPDASGK